MKEYGKGYMLSGESIILLCFILKFYPKAVSIYKRDL